MKKRCLIILFSLIMNSTSSVQAYSLEELYTYVAGLFLTRVHHEPSADYDRFNNILTVIIAHVAVIVPLVLIAKKSGVFNLDKVGKED